MERYPPARALGEGLGWSAPEEGKQPFLEGGGLRSVVRHSFACFGLECNVSLPRAAGECAIECRILRRPGVRCVEAIGMGEILVGGKASAEAGQVNPIRGLSSFTSCNQSLSRTCRARGAKEQKPY